MAHAHTNRFTIMPWLIVGDNERWRCYVCDPKPLLGLIEHCSAVMEALARQEKLESDKRRKPDASSKPIMGSQYQSASVKVVSGSKPAAHPVSVIQTASVATIAKARMPSSVEVAKQGSAKMTARTFALLSEQHQQQISKLASKTVASLLAKHKKPVATAAASSQSQTTPSALRAARPTQIHNIVTSQNVLIVLDRLLSATNSMNVFLQSLRMDARKNAIGTTQAHYEKRREIAGKLTRAYAAYTRSFQEVATHSSSSSSSAAASSQTARVNVTKAQQSSAAMRAPSTSHTVASSTSVRPPSNNQRPVVSRPPVISTSSEVIEISDSEDDRASVSVVKRKAQHPATSQPNAGIPVTSGKVTENRIIAVAPVKVVNQNATDAKKRTQSPDGAVSYTAAKRARVDNDSKPDLKPQASSGEDGVMFDGGVEEIPHDDVDETSDSHNLQMYCVEVNEDSDDSDTPLSDIRLANGGLQNASATSTASGRPMKPRSLLEAELTRGITTSRSVIS